MRAGDSLVKRYPGLSPKLLKKAQELGFLPSEWKLPTPSDVGRWWDSSLAHPPLTHAPTPYPTLTDFSKEIVLSCLYLT